MIYFFLQFQNNSNFQFKEQEERENMVTGLNQSMEIDMNKDMFYRPKDNVKADQNTLFNQEEMIGMNKDVQYSQENLFEVNPNVESNPEENIFSNEDVQHSEQEETESSPDEQSAPEEPTEMTQEMDLPQNGNIEIYQDMDFPPGWKIEVTRVNGKTRARYIDPRGQHLTNIRQLIARFPKQNFSSFNRHTGKFERGHRNSAWKNRKKWMPQYQYEQTTEAPYRKGARPKLVAKRKLKRISSKLQQQYYTSEPVYLNSILCSYLGFEHSEELFKENEEFLQELCDLTPSDDPEWGWVWKKDQGCQNFTEDENTERGSFFVGIWEDECFKRPLGPLYPHEEDVEELLKEAEEMRRKMEEEEENGKKRNETDVE